MTTHAAHTLRFVAKPGTADELVAVFAQALPYILEDTTTVSWFVGRRQDDPATFVLAHAFVDEAARSAHFESPAAKLIMTEGAPFFASDPAIENFSVIAGSKAKG